MKSSITTHVLDTMSGKPAAGVSVKLEMLEAQVASRGKDLPESFAAKTPSLPDQWKELATAATNADGRIMDLFPGILAAGEYRLTFETGMYFRSSGIETFYPHVIVTFEVKDPAAHYHVPLLVSPFGYSTYRGS